MKEEKPIEKKLEVLHSLAGRNINRELVQIVIELADRVARLEKQLRQKKLSYE